MGKAITEIDSYAGPMSGTTKLPVSDSDTLQAGTASQVLTYIVANLGNAATKNTGTTAGTVAAGDHTHSSYETSIADAKVKGVTVLLPVTNDEITLFRARAAMTITKLVAVGGGFTYTVRKAADRSATGTEVVTGGSTVTSTTTGDAVTSFNSASIAAGDYVWLKLTSVTGTPASFNLTMEYT